MTIEPPLIESLLDDLSAVKADIDHTGQSEVNAKNGAAFNVATLAHTAATTIARVAPAKRLHARR